MFLYLPGGTLCCKLLRSPGIKSASICSLAGRYDNPIPTRFLVPHGRFYKGLSLPTYSELSSYCLFKNYPLCMYIVFLFTGRNPLLLTTTTTLPTSPAASRLFCKCRRRRRRLTAHLAAPRRRNWRSRVRHISPRHRRKSALRRQVRVTAGHGPNIYKDTKP